MCRLNCYFSRAIKLLAIATTVGWMFFFLSSCIRMRRHFKIWFSVWDTLTHSLSHRVEIAELSCDVRVHKDKWHRWNIGVRDALSLSLPFHFQKKRDEKKKCSNEANFIKIARTKMILSSIYCKTICKRRFLVAFDFDVFWMPSQLQLFMWAGLASLWWPRNVVHTRYTDKYASARLALELREEPFFFFLGIWQ